MKKQFLSWKRYVLVLLIFHSTQDTFAQQGENVHPFIQSCFQLIAMNGETNEYTVLRSQYFQFNYTGSDAADPEFWYIQQFDAEGAVIHVDYTEMGLADVFFSVINIPDIGKSVRSQKVKDGIWTKNRNLFTFGNDVKTVSIIPIQYKEAPPGSGNWIYQMESNGVVLHLEEPEDLIEIEPLPDETCYKFDDFRFNVDHQGIDGFCGKLESFCIRLDDPPHPSGWPSNFQQCELKPGQANQIDLASAICESSCLNVIAPHNLPEPEPCGCVDFLLDIEILPCNDAPFECEPLVVEKKLTLCCECDVRGPAPQN